MSASKDKAQYSKSPITPEDQAKFKKVFASLENDRQANAFLEPVDYVALDILDYPSIIKRPMDLGTVKKKMLTEQYDTFADLLSDVDLIWANCRLYNVQGSDICKMAQHCEKLFKKQFDKHFKTAIKKVEEDKEEESSTTKNDSLNMTEKMELTEKIRVLSNEGLSAVVKAIMKDCPKGIEDIDAEKLQIKVDLIDRKTYDQLLTLIESFLKKQTDNKEKQ